MLWKELLYTGPQEGISLLRQRKTIIILDAFASGLLGADSEGVISKQMTEWLEHLAEKPGFVEQQTAQWSEAINLKRKPINADSYTYLKKYPFLLPAAWISRIGKYLIESQGTEHNDAMESIEIGNKRIDLMKKYKIIQ